MALDSTLIGQVAAELMESLSDRYGMDESAHVREAMVIVVVGSQTNPDTGEEDNEPDGYGIVHSNCSEVFWHRQLGILEAARLSVAR